jgi:4-carboxymuconolactone decarboxylase
MGDSEKRKKGEEIINKVYGKALPPWTRTRFTDFMLETLFAELWANETLSFKERRLLLLGAIAAQGEENTFGIQAAAALNNGELTQEQLQEAIMFLTQYVGYPLANKMNTALNGVIQARAQEEK